MAIEISRKMGIRSKFWLRTEENFWTKVAFLAVVYLIFTALTHERIPSDNNVYWNGWADQQKYVASMRAFARLDFSPGNHWYPSGYSLIVVPLSWLPAWLAMTIVNGGCFIGTWFGFKAVAARFSIDVKIALPIFLATTLFYPIIGEHWITPWTTTFSAFLIWQAAGRVLALEDECRWGEGFCLGVILALIPATRPADVVVAGFIAGYAVFHAVRCRRLELLLPIVVGGAITSVFFVALHILIYGWALSDYMRMSADYGLNFQRLGWKAYLILIEPRPWFPEGCGLLAACPWMLVGACGMCAALLPGQSRRSEVVMLIAIAVIYSVLMLAYVDLLPSGLWFYGNVHYFKWLLPLFALFAVIFLRVSLNRPVACAGLVVAFLLVTSVRFEPVQVSANEPARALLLPGAGSDAAQVYMAHSVIVDRGGTLRNFYEYHQVPRADNRVIAIALRRDFAGRENWQGNGEELAYWPRASTTIEVRAPLPGHWPKVPIARFAPRISFGVPCWLPFAQCRSEIN
jgi:hypothetical protein